MVIAFSGRQIDAPDADEARFPPTQESKVAEKIEAELQKLKATVLVCSASCGADILALEVAGRLTIRRSVVLPFDRDTFRDVAIKGCPGNWGERYEVVMDEVKSGGDVVILGFDVTDTNAYTATSNRILAEARTTALGLADTAAAVLVWDGQARGSDDLSAHFLQEAERASLPITQIMTV